MGVKVGYPGFRGHLVLRARIQRYSRSLKRCSLPVSVRGSAAAKVTWRRSLHFLAACPALLITIQLVDDILL